MILPVGIGIAVVAAGSASYWLIRKRANYKAKQRGDAPASAAEAKTTGKTKPPAKPAPAVKELSSLPESAKNQLVNAVWYRCENPYCNRTNFLEVHHIVSEVEGGTNALDNLIVLCADCHRLADKNEIPLDVMKSWITQKKDRFRDNLDWQYK